VIALFATEVIQGISHAMSLKWVIEAQAETGPFCTAQGLLQQFGETGVALVTLTIAVQTFLGVWRLSNPSRQLSAYIVGVEAIFLVLIVAIGFGVHTRPPIEFYAAPSPYWCWLGDGFLREKIGLEYLWFWITAFGSFLLYIPLFLLHFQLVKPGVPSRWYLPKVDISSHVDGDNVGNGIPSTTAAVLSKKNAKLWSAILYPILYFILVLPLSVVRFINFHRPSHRRPIETFIVANIFTLSGVFNALLYRLTRASIFMDSEPPPPTAPPVAALDAASRTELGVANRGPVLSSP